MISSWLFQALYFESNKVEEWESEREEVDDHLFKIPEGEAAAELRPEEMETLKALQALFNQGEDPRTVEGYKAAVQKLLRLTNEIPIAAAV